MEQHIGEPSLKGLFHISDTRREGDYTVGRVFRLGSSGKVLGAN